MLVDHQSHFHPPGYFEELLRRTGYPRVSRDGDGYALHVSEQFTERFSRAHVDLETHLSDMDKYGVDLAVVSPTAIGEALGLDRSEAVDTLEMVNELMARTQREVPERFKALAVLPVA